MSQTSVAQLENSINAGSWNEAERILFQSAAAQPYNALLLRALGITHYQVQRHFLAASALKLASNAIELDEEVRFMLVTAYIKVERRHWALAELQHLLAEDPENSTYLHTLACVYYAQQRFTDDIGELQKALNHQPDFTEAYDRLANARKQWETLTRLRNRTQGDFIKLYG